MYIVYLSDPLVKKAAFSLAQDTPFLQLLSEVKRKKCEILFSKLRKTNKRVSESQEGF